MSANGIKTQRVQPKGIFEKYLYSSVLQKSVRRCYVESALNASRLFLEHDPAYIWRRINIIALEDVGIANLDLVSRCLWVSGKKDWRKKNGGDEHILYELIEAMCLSAKDRNFCDAVEAADHHPDFRDVRYEYSGLSDEQLVELITSTQTGLYHRIIATWVLMGTSRYPSKNITSYRNQSDKVIGAYIALGVPEKVIELFKLAKGKSSDNMAVGIMPVWFHVVTQKLVQSVAREKLLSDEIVNGIPLAAFDKHTWQGKKAIERFCYSCTPLNEFLKQHVRQEEWVRYVGWVLFCIEGDNVNRRLKYEGYFEPKWRMLEGQLITTTFLRGNLSHLKTIMLQNLHSLNKARNQAN